MRGLGDSTPKTASWWTGITQNSLNPLVFLPEDWAYIKNSDWSVVPSVLTAVVSGNPTSAALPIGREIALDLPFFSFDTASNAVYGSPTQSQIDQIKADAARQIAKASGGNSALAQQQTQAASSEIDSVVNSYGGVAPSLANIALPIDPTSPFDVPWWVWAAGAAAVGLYLVKR
jgi:hypothetical protein